MEKAKKFLVVVLLLAAIATGLAFYFTLSDILSFGKNSTMSSGHISSAAEEISTVMKYPMYIPISTSILLLLLIVIIAFSVRNSRKSRQLRDQIVTLSTIYTSLPDMVYSMDINGTYTSCNNAFEEFTGFTKSEIIGKVVTEVFYSDIIMAYKFLAADKRVIKDKSMVKSQEWLICPDKSKRLFEIVKVPLMHNNEVIGILGIDRDITQFHEAERAAQEASRAKSNFLAKMSHEIRTPMNAIIGMAELALRENNIDESHKHILTAKQAGVHLLSIINDILDFSKIEMGKLEIITGDYYFSSLVNDVISIIRMKVLDSQIRFTVNIDSKIQNALIGDETRIRQVLLNVLNNAVKYTEKGFVSFSATKEAVDEETINLVLEVKDSGKGIKEKDIKTLFGEYTQFDLEKNRGIEGVGLGLAITWNIVKAMGGDIQVNSIYGKGSTFTITLPQKIRSNDILAHVDNPENKNVLVYERREIYANSIVKSINNLDLKCTLVSDDNKLREALSASTFPFIFISYKLLENNKDVIYKNGSNSKIVILSEFGEAIPDRNLNILAMPVYSTSIANILNGISESFSYRENDENIVRFIAPSAKVLIVDDINTNLKVAEGLLLPFKMQIDLLNSGKEAIEAVKKTRYDLIFMDHKMPEMDGIEAAKHIRELDNDDLYYQNVPMVILTANAVSGTKQMFLENGFNDFLSKPIDMVKLKTILEKWIPREKQRAFSDKVNEESISNTKTESRGVEIKGLNIEKGIYLSGGVFDIFMETLAIFMRDGYKKIEELRQALDTKNLHLYTIHVHALKSASANIGAMELSETAKNLEMAGEKQDIDFIETFNPQFIAELESLLRNIDNELQKYKEEKKPIKQSFDMDSIKPDLVILKTALDVLDAGIINKTIDDLRKNSLPEDIGNIINDISDKILVCEYDEAVELINKLLQI